MQIRTERKLSILETFAKSRGNYASSARFVYIKRGRNVRLRDRRKDCVMSTWFLNDPKGSQRIIPYLGENEDLILYH